MPTIENVSAIDFQNGNHTASGHNSIAIQIIDPCGWVPIPKAKFSAIYQFEFLDIDNPHDTSFGEFAITKNQAYDMTEILLCALDANMNVVVHCTAGICRSGAVTEVGSIMGFEPIHNNRIPNILVKKRMMECLGLTYDASVSDVVFNNNSSGAVVTRSMENMVWN